MTQSKQISIAVAASLTLFAGGLYIGRSNPPHHFERFGSSQYLYDSTTGAFCNAFPGPVKDSNGLEVTTPNPFDQSLGDPHGIPPCGIVSRSN